MLNLVDTFDTLVSKRDIALSDIDRPPRQTTFQQFKGKFIVQPSLSRSLVSFQANKTRPVYRRVVVIKLLTMMYSCLLLKVLSDTISK